MGDILLRETEFIQNNRINDRVKQQSQEQQKEEKADLVFCVSGAFFMHHFEIITIFLMVTFKNFYLDKERSKD